MANNNPNPLLQPPFFLIEGIDPSSPISAQTEQIDQLNTLLLQEIDANFARFHQIVTSRILPEIKRFAIAGEPTREAALFWRSFFEAASAVRLAGPGDSTLDAHANEDASTAYDDHTLTLRQNDADYTSRLHEEGSFIFDPPPPGGAVSSTPLPPGRSINQSWEDSMESPFDRLDRQLRDDLKIDKGYEDASASSSDMPTPSLPSGYSLPGLTARNTSELSSLHEGHSTGTVGLDQLSLNEVYTRPQPPSQAASASATPRAKSARQPHPSSASKNQNNPFGAGFSGIADLRSTPLNVKSKSKRPQQTGASSSTAALAHMDDDSDDDIPFGMSPPVTMNFTLLPRAQAVMNVAKASATPAKSRTPRASSMAGAGGAGENEAKHILDDLLEEMGSELSPRLDTPEGLGRYSMLPGEMEAGRLLFQNQDGASTSGAGLSSHHIEEEDEEGEGDETFHGGSAASASGSGMGINPAYLNPNRLDGLGDNRRSLANTSYGSDTGAIQIPSDQMIYSTDGGEDSFNSSDSEDDGTYSGTATGSVQGTVSSAPYSLAPFPGSGEVGSASGGMAQAASGVGALGAQGGTGMQGHRIITGFEDDSFLSEADAGDISGTSEAGVIFGRAPHPHPGAAMGMKRQSSTQGQGHFAGLANRNPAFNLRKQDEMDTYHGGKLELAGDDPRDSPSAGLGRGRTG